MSFTIRIFAKFNKPLSVKFGVPSSINVRSDRYIPRYGIHGGSVRCNESLKLRYLPSEDTKLCNFSTVCFV